MKHWLLVFFALIPLVPRSSNAALLYGMTNIGQLFTTDTTTLTTVAIGSAPASPTSGYIGLASNGTNLYTFSSTTNSFYQLNSTTGAQQTITAITSGIAANSVSEGDFYFTSPTTGFISSAGFSTYTWYSFNLSTGTAVQLGACNQPNATALCTDGFTRTGLDGLYRDGSTTYGFQGNNASGRNFVTINEANGARTLVGNTGLDALTFGSGGITRDPTNGNVWAVISATGVANLYQVNPTTGAFTLQGVLNGISPTASVVGLYYAGTNEPTNPIPEPATALVTVAGALAIWLRSRRNTKA